MEHEFGLLLDEVLPLLEELELVLSHFDLEVVLERVLGVEEVKDLVLVGEVDLGMGGKASLP